MGHPPHGTIKVFAESDRDDFAIERIIDAVKRYAPPFVEFTDNENEADLVILFVYGFRRHTKYHIGHIQERGQKYAMVQLCVRSTPNPNTISWTPLWENAESVWSYYDLPAMCTEDGVDSTFNFYYAPLGVEPQIFTETSTHKRYIVASTGTGSRFSNECKNEIIAAAESLGKKVFQLGEGENTETITYSNNMNDEDLAKHYSQCAFVSGLHWVEGFELPVIEGILCGARPICFDTPIFRHWFDTLAEFIPEDPRVEDNVQALFLHGARPVSDREKEFVRNTFNWEKLVTGFWESMNIKI